MNRYILGAASALAAMAAPFAAQAGLTTYNFDTPVTLSDTQAPGTWYTDRYAPAGFVAGEDFGSRKVLVQTISDADSATNRPAPFSSTFYNTQGRKLDTPNVNRISIELFVDAIYGESLNQRVAGFWGTAFGFGGAVSAYPIIEYTTEGVDRFRGWDPLAGGDGWVDLLTTPATDEWYTLAIELVGGDFKYFIDGVELYSFSAGGSTEIGNVILQGHNTTDGSNYDIRWDNLTTVPEPATLLLLGFGMAGLAIARRRA